MSLELRGVTKAYRDPSGGRVPVLNVAHFKLDAGEQADASCLTSRALSRLLREVIGLLELMGYRQ